MGIDERFELLAKQHGRSGHRHHDDEETNAQTNDAM
jgi:hypothetical protein